MSDLPYELLMKIQHGTMNTLSRGVPMPENPFDLALYAMLLAIHEFLARSAGRYEIDRTLYDYYSRYEMWNVDGYLRRVR